MCIAPASGSLLLVDYSFVNWNRCVSKSASHMVFSLSAVTFVVLTGILFRIRVSAKSNLFITVFFTYTAGATTTAAGTILPIPMDFPNSPYRIESNPNYNYTCYNHSDSFPAGTPQLIRCGLPILSVQFALVAKMVY